MSDRKRLAWVLVGVMAAAPTWAGIRAEAAGDGDGGIGAQALHRQIASPESGYFSPKAQFNNAGANVASPVGGYTANGFMTSSGQVMNSPQGMGGTAPGGGHGGMGGAGAGMP